MRSKILEVFDNISSNTAQELYSVFDASIEEVEKLLQTGVWQNFIVKFKLYNKEQGPGLSLKVSPF